MKVPTALELAPLLGKHISVYREASDVERVTNNQDFVQAVFGEVTGIEEAWKDGELFAVEITGVPYASTVVGSKTGKERVMIRADDPFPWRWTIWTEESDARV